MDVLDNAPLLAVTLHENVFLPTLRLGIVKLYSVFPVTDTADDEPTFNVKVFVPPLFAELHGHPKSPP